MKTLLIVVGAALAIFIVYSLTKARTSTTNVRQEAPVANAWTAIASLGSELIPRLFAPTTGSGTMTVQDPSKGIAASPKSPFAYWS